MMNEETRSDPPCGCADGVPCDYHQHEHEPAEPAAPERAGVPPRFALESYRVEEAREGDRAVGIIPLPPQAGVIEIKLPKGAGVFGVTQVAVPVNGSPIVGLDDLAQRRPQVIDAPALVIHADMSPDVITESRYFALVPGGAKAPPLFAVYLGCVSLGGRLAVLVFELPIPSEPAEVQTAFDFGGPVP